MLETMTGGRTRRVAGAARRERERAPFVPGLHDFRNVFRNVDVDIPTEEEAQGLERRVCDVDASFSALMTLDRKGAEDGETVVGYITATEEFAMVGLPNGWRLYGQKGVLLIDEVFAPVQAFRQRDAQAEREPLPVPPMFLDTAPSSGNNLVDMWTILGRDFVSDIRGEPYNPYPTFHDGWRLQVAIDAIRSGSGWTEIPD